MTGAAAGPGGTSSARAVPLGALIAALFALLSLDNVLLLGFVGYVPAAVAALAVALPAALAYLAWRAVQSSTIRLSYQLVLACFAIAAALLILGGEGRLLYANEDWQIRDAVLRDMASHRWPFDYWLEGTSQILRAPVGMYLVPALAGSASQAARDWAMLAHNIVILGLIIALGAALIETRRARWIALLVFIAFSGLDVIGTMIINVLTGGANWNHLDQWAGRFQFSSHITQIFWVPQHAIAGWACAILYLLWRSGRVPIGLFAGIIPLVALWSPFAIFGALPFALFAGIRTLLSGRWTWRDVAFTAIALAIAVPALLYLRADAEAVGGGFRPPPLIVYVLIIVLEVLPFTWPLLRDRSGVMDRATLWIATGFLLLAPALAIGPHTDFQMRATIMPLAIAAIAFADWMGRLRAAGAKAYAVIILALGSVTGAAELYRAFAMSPSPVPLCSLQSSWTKQTGLVVPHSTYFARRAHVSPLLQPADPVERAGLDDPARCWDRAWRTSR